jgi:starch-binding outer membrane protein, SusD/RagB family
MKKFQTYIIISIIATTIFLSGCKQLFDEKDIQNNPNAVTDVDVRTLLSGTMLGVAFLHEDTDVRIATMWSGQLNGLSRAHLGFGQYIVSSQTFSWNNLYPVANQARLIQTKADVLGDKWTKGVGQILEALVIAKATALYGDVPYSQAFDIQNFPTPIFDKQEDVYASLQITLDKAISNLSATSGLAFGANDFIYQGDVNKWKALANTLKARLYLHTKNYDKAIASANLGIQNTNADALISHGTSQGQNTNQNYDFFRVSRAGDTGFEGSYLRTLLQSRINSANTKTNETALYNHIIKVGVTAPNSQDPNTTDGAFVADAPHPIITSYENQLIIAESEARLGNTNNALTALNKVRASLANGYFNGKTFSSNNRKYEAYAVNDFVVLGSVNPKNLPTIQEAMLYEIISQRYIILLMQYEVFNDYRRLASASPVVQLPIPLIVGTKKPQRFIYPQQEINSNPNVPQSIPDQFMKVSIFP